MLLGTNYKSGKIENRDREYDEADILSMMNSERYYEAFQLLDSLQSKGSSDHYNMALCYYHTELFDEALACLSRIDTSQTKLKMMTSRSVSTHALMFNNQSKLCENFLNPFSRKYMNEYPELANDAILRLRVKIYLLLEHWSEVLKLSNLIKNTRYADLATALEFAESKITQNDK